MTARVALNIGASTSQSPGKATSDFAVRGAPARLFWAQYAEVEASRTGIPRLRGCVWAGHFGDDGYETAPHGAGAEMFVDPAKGETITRDGLTTGRLSVDAP